MIAERALMLAEKGLVPLPLLRLGVRHLLEQRLEECTTGPAIASIVKLLRESPVALATEIANEQHYEVPAAFYQVVLGPHLKYSSGLWNVGTTNLGSAEEAMLLLTCERAGLQDGQRILELGCGWGSLTLFMARRYPNARIVAVSNSSSQRAFILDQAPPNVAVVTADMNSFDIGEQFDRVVSVEMFEHMRNYEVLLHRIAGWLAPEGRLFVHIFCHRDYAYPFEAANDSDWMARHFFTAGLMPSYDLLRHFENDLVVEDDWAESGTHYAQTARAWREQLEARREEVLRIFASSYGSEADRWFQRWRLFFLACEELFGYADGKEWLVGHYRFRKLGSAPYPAETSR